MDNGSRSSLKPFKRDASEAMTGQTSSVPSPPQRPRKKNRNSISQAEEEEAKARGYLKHAEFLARNLEGVAARSGVQRPSAAFDTLPPRRGKKRKRGNEGLTEHDCPVC